MFSEARPPTSSCPTDISWLLDDRSSESCGEGDASDHDGCPSDHSVSQLFAERAATLWVFRSADVFQRVMHSVFDGAIQRVPDPV